MRRWSLRAGRAPGPWATEEHPPDRGAIFESALGEGYSPEAMGLVGTFVEQHCRARTRNRLCWQCCTAAGGEPPGGVGVVESLPFLWGLSSFFQEYPYAAEAVGEILVGAVFSAALVSDDSFRGCRRSLPQVLGSPGATTADEAKGASFPRSASADAPQSPAWHVTPRSGSPCAPRRNGHVWLGPQHQGEVRPHLEPRQIWMGEGPGTCGRSVGVRRSGARIYSRRDENAGLTAAVRASREKKDCRVFGSLGAPRVRRRQEVEGAIVPPPAYK